MSINKSILTPTTNIYKIFKGLDLFIDIGNKLSATIYIYNDNVMFASQNLNYSA